MHKKRDRCVEIYLHKSSHAMLLIPYIWHMDGVGDVFGDPVELVSPVEPAAIGKHITHLLRTCKSADIDVLKERHMNELRSYWKGNGYKQIEPGKAWESMQSKYPALSRGPGTYLRQFSVCQIIERDRWRHHKIVRVVRSQYRGGTQDGETKRVPIATQTKTLGKHVIELLQS